MVTDDKPPRFFIPGVAAAEEEQVYSEMATRNRSLAVPSIGRRLYAITHHHKGDLWFVTVGKILTGRRLNIAIDDPALVLAIFLVPSSGRCWVHTDGGTSVGKRSSWMNPFLAGEVDQVQYFLS
jgi:hypothetical protein